MAATNAPAQTNSLQTSAIAIAPQPLAGALQVWAEQTGWQLMYDSGLAVDETSNGAPGGLHPFERLTQILKGTGLAYHFLSERTVAIVPANRLSGRSRSPLLKRTRASDADRRPLQLADAGSQASTDEDKTSLNAEEGLTEVLVTAQKRSERLQDVPVPVTSIGAEALVNSNQLRLQDYYTRIPGLSLTPADVHGAPVLAIRGVTTGGFSNPTVGITVDDVPYGSSTNIGGGYEAPDIDPSELARVEVLRGPQGTLYGASSIGGLLKFVTVDPSMAVLSGRVQVSLNSVHNGDELGRTVRGSVNVPLSDTLAVRASGFTRRDPGYVDDPTLGVDGVNRATASGGRLSALWRPTDVFALKLNALIQDSKAEGSSDVELESNLGDLEQSAVRGTGFFNKKIQSYSATAMIDMGGIDLTSVSAYGVTTSSDAFDYTFVFGDFTQETFGVPGTPYQNRYKTDKFTQEVRLSGPTGENIEWLLGGFYTHEISQLNGNLLAADPTTGEIVGALFQSDIPSSFEEYAAFADVTFKITDQFDIQLGGRESQNKQTYAETDVGPLVGGELINDEVSSKDNSFTYLVTPRLRLSRDFMLYARMASGYRAGGPNPNSSGLGVPSRFGPDKTQNYEIGVKADVLEHRLSFDASVYYIDWKNIQLQLDSSGFLYYVNASRAKSQGVELAVESRPLQGLEIAAWVAWNTAELTEDFPADSSVRGISGDRLPGSSRFSGNLSIDEEFSVTNNVTAFVGGSLSYVGNRQGNFTLDERQNLSSYSQADLRGGVKYDTWAVNLFVNNVADKRGMLAGGLGTLNPVAFKYIQPRTVGLSLAKTF